MTQVPFTADGSARWGAAVRLPRRQVAAASIGNLVEFFDWQSYTLLAIYFSTRFFDPHDPLAALLGAFAILAVGFFVRPLSGLLIGALADRRGRRFALLLTVYGMGAATLAMALTPTYDVIGVWAPIILLLARVIQGICIGGEIGAMVSFAMEVSPDGRRSRVAGIIVGIGYAGQVFCTLLIFSLVATIGSSAMSEWGWRAVFLVGALLSLAGVWIRRRMVETGPPASPRGSRVGVLDGLRRFPRAWFQVVRMTAGLTAMTYAWSVYMPTYAATGKGLDPGLGILSTSGALLVAVVSCLTLGRVVDRRGRRPAAIVAAAVLTLGTVPALLFVNDEVWRLMLVQSLAMVCIAALTVATIPWFAELFPSRVRASGLGFAYQLTVGLVGGTVPFIGTQLTAIGFADALPFYLSALMLISLVCYALSRETAFEPLPE